LKRYFITGLLIWVPLGITAWVLSLLVGTMDQSLLLLPESWRPKSWLGFSVPGLGVVLTLVVILLTGVFAANLIGQRLIAFWEKALARIPVVKSIYYSVKQVSDAVFSGTGEAFRKVLLVRFPHTQAWSIAFQTNMPGEIADKLDGEHVGVFIPTTPSPVNGFYFYVRKSETVELDITVDSALKCIVSMGVVVSSDKEQLVKTYAGD
jgi:uncharacterized membrane protein